MQPCSRVPTMASLDIETDPELLPDGMGWESPQPTHPSTRAARPGHGKWVDWVDWFVDGIGQYGCDALNANLPT